MIPCRKALLSLLPLVSLTLKFSSSLLKFCKISFVLFLLLKNEKLITNNEQEFYLFMLAHQLLLRLFQFASLLVNFGVKNGFHFFLHLFHLQTMLTEIFLKHFLHHNPLTVSPRSSVQLDSLQMDSLA